MYAEGLKGDSGGVYWVQNLKAVQLSLLIYILLMTGVLYERATSKLCGTVAMGSLIYWKYAYDLFMRERKMDSLSFEELKEYEGEHRDQDKGRGKRDQHYNGSHNLHDKPRSSSAAAQAKDKGGHATIFRTKLCC